MAVVPVTFRVPAKRAYLLVLLDALVKLDRLQIRQMDLPPLYEARVRYRREARDPRTGKRKEEWRTIVDVLEAGGIGDCEDLAAYRVAELKEQGINATIWLTKQGRTWHVRVRHPDGRIEDPSLRLGMNAPPQKKARVA